MGFCCRISILNSTQKVRALLAATYNQYGFIRKGVIFSVCTQALFSHFLNFQKTSYLISSTFFLKLLKISDCFF
jgi:hypothetical protein